jgi:hypothetical protein
MVGHGVNMTVFMPSRVVNKPSSVSVFRCPIRRQFAGWISGKASALSDFQSL